MQRRRLGSLRSLRIGRAATQRYTAAVQKFLAWVIQGNYAWPASTQELDWLLVWYLEALWDAGESRNTAGDTLSGIQHFLHIRKSLHAGWSLFATWNKMELPARAPPLISDILIAMIALCLLHQREDLSTLLSIGFHCMLRTEEMLGIRFEDLSVSSANVGAVALPWTKSGQIRGAQEIVTIDDPMVGLLIRKHVASASGISGKILQGTHAQFRQWFVFLLTSLGLGRFNFRPYSIRRGGATHDFSTFGSIERTVWRGRWSDSRTARIYITDGLARQLQQQLSHAEQLQLQAAKTFLCQHLA